MSVSSEQVVEALRTSVKEAERLRSQNKQLLAKRSEPIAIVGIGCRFPGGVASPRDLWEMVSAGTDAITDSPTDRGWDMERFFDPDPERVGTTYVRRGGFLHDLAEFDAAFFGIGPREALTMDPQHRLLLEGAWEALEDAGVDPGSMRGTQTGVFVGTAQPDYSPGGITVVPGMEALLGTGLSTSVASGRVAYTLGLEGPAVTIDTACSSSLVAMHLAAQALRADECELALAGGVTVHSSLSTFIGMSRQRGLAPDGRPKSFAGAADGTAWGEGCGILLLERLSTARAKNRRILGLIKGSATNQDGASNGLIAPNGPSQERVIRQALANAGLTASEVDAVEGHGTGTPLGDPIEAQALLATYGQEREDGPLQLGSLKSNVGHTVAAAGVGGVIKMVMALREEALPKTLHVDEPTPHVDWDSGEIELLTEPREWKRGDRPRRAGVSSFGISGTNAHLILEEAPEQPAGEAEETERPPLIPWAISAKTPEALAEYAGRLAAHVETEEPDPIDVAHTLLASRASLPHRAVVVGESEGELLAGLEALAQGRPAPGLAVAKVSHGKTAFLFSGQGSQRAEMGKGLYEAFPVYREAFEEACAVLEAELGKDVKAAVFAEVDSELSLALSRTDLTQASLFALEVALYRLLSSFGAKPDYLIGHSIGEIAAAQVAGVLSLEDAAKLVAARGSLMAALPEGGAMASVRGGEEVVEESIAPYGGALCIAAVNAPTSIVVSGDEDALSEWEQAQEREGRKTKRLDVSHAFHSQRIEPMLAEFERLVSTLELKAPEIPIVSNVSGEELTEEQATSPAYWASHARQAVRFAQGIAWLRERGVGRFLELGPDAVLSAIAAECIEEEGIALTATLRREQPEALCFGAALGALRASGGKADLSPLCSAGSLVELPTYPFQRERYWLIAGGSTDAASLGQSATEHPMLAASISLAREREQVFTGRLSTESHLWLADHVVAGTVVVPGTAFCEIALSAGAELGIERLEELVMEAPLLLGEADAVQLQLSVVAGEADPERFELAIHSRPEPGGEDEDELPWVRHASGTLVSDPEPLALGFDATAWPPPGAEPVEVDAFYDLTVAAGFEYGLAFQGLEAAWRLGGEVYGEISLAEEQRAEADRFGVHPALLDAALHPALVEAAGSGGGLRLPFSFAGVSLGAGRGAAQLRVRVRVEDERISLAAASPEGDPVCAISSLTMRPVEALALDGRRSPSADLFQRTWETVESAAGSEEADVEVHRLAAPEDLEPDAAAHRLCAEALAAIQAFLADEGSAERRLAFVGERGIALSDEESPDPAVSAAWGLIRCAQSEHPGRFTIVDSDGSEASEEALFRAIAGAEPEVVLRDGRAGVPRLAPAEETGSGAAPGLDPEGTVLVSGGLSGLGAIAARHLAEAHGVRRLLLAGRGGADTPGAEELIARLGELGAEATAVACDVSDREQVEALFDGIAAEHPLTAIVHCAGVLDDGTVESLDSERLSRVFAPKVDGAWNLHELSAGHELAAFVLYSSAAAAFGNPGQGNYAAANSFLDALAQRRRAEELPATSIAWGMWESGMAAGLSEAERARLGRSGLTLIDAERGTGLFDRALALGDPAPVAVPLDHAALRTLDGAGLLPPILAGLVPAARRRGKVAAGSLARRLAEVEEAEREAVVLREVREHVAAILGHSSADAVDPQANFKDLGFDSLGAVELRNRLSQATGVRLEATLVFDYPSSGAIASYLLRQVESGSGAAVAVRAARGVDEPIAIVGIGCRFPGGASSPERFWELLAEGRDGISEFPSDRGWDVERLYDPDPARTGKSYVREGGFIENVADFDPAFFGIGPREALAMDPQQRLLLETSWETLQDAGIDPLAVRGSSTGVYAGVMMADYAEAGAALSSAGLEGFGTGIAGSVASGRIAYALGLEGPAVTIDTACSSSLVAMHLAAQALRGGECELALAGGVTVLSTPIAFVEFSRQRVFAADARAKSFAASADGASWGEGCGIVALERLSDAKRNGRRILAVLRGSATNQDGASNGLTAPNGPSQERVIRQALANAGLKPGEVDAVEGHGTGTVLGDPIEAGALLATYGQERENGPLALGSLKSNFGHTQAAAGVGGVIKMVMALQEEALPPTLHVDEPTPHVDWDSGEVELLTERREWKRGDRPRRAGVSSFGISGTNAHLILEEAPVQPAPAGDEGEGTERPPLVAWALSAKTPEALREYAGRLAAHVERAEPDPLDVAHTLLASRASLPQRAVAVGADTEELLAGLDALAQGRPAPGLARAKVSHGKTAFLFSGQGAQRAGMGRELHDAFPVYREAFDEACAALESELGKDVKEAVFAEAGSELSQALSRTDLTQASLFALEVALFRLLASFGARPDYLIGHSIGEVSAAHVAGVLSLEDAAKLVAARGRLMAALPEGGAMASVRASEGEVEESLAAYEGRLCIAAVNAPASISVSGDEDALAEWEKAQEEAGRKVKRLDVSHAFHSHRIEPMLAEFEQLVSTLDLSAPEIPIVSNLSGEELTEEQATSPAYWADHARRAVRFAAGIARLRELGTSRFVELGPDAVLTAIAAECVEEREGIAFAAILRREQPEALCLGAALGALRASGGAVDLSSLCSGGSLVALPPYPFQRERYWLAGGGGSADATSLGQSATEHPMLTASISLAREREQVFTGRLSAESHPWLADHVVAGTVIVPGTAFCEIALRAGAELGAERLEELVMEAPLLLSGSEVVQLQLSVAAVEADAERFELAIHSRPEPREGEGDDAPWVRHASGTLLSEHEPLALDFDATAWPPPGAEPVDVDAFYDLTVGAGFEYGPAFQGLEAAWRLGGEVFGEISLAEMQAAEADRFGIHPALLDAALHPALVEAIGAEGSVRLPFSFSGVSLGAGRGAAQLRVRVRVEDERISLAAASATGEPVCAISALAMRPAETLALAARPSRSSDLFQRAWETIEIAAPSEAAAVEVHRLTPPEGLDPAAAAHRLGAETLAAIQAFLADESRAEQRLAFLSERAIGTGDEATDPAVAAAWGLVRSAQSEHPGRFVLVDGDDSEASEETLTGAVGGTEPEVVLREGRAAVPRLAPAAESADAPLELDPEGTVLISGGLSGLGAIAARHLVEAHGARHLLLAGRRGADSEGAEELIARLAELGAEASAVACDVSDRAEVEAMLDRVAAERPLTAIVHCAGVLDDGTVESLDPERLDRVLAPKVDGAWNLHELSAGLDLAAFVLYSSAAATLGSPGQGNYAAANSFLDALARRRHEEGLPATSIAWGMWESGMAAGLSDAERARLGRSGLTLIDAERGAELLDRALGLGDPAPVAVPLDRATLRTLDGAGLLPPVLSGLVPTARRRAKVAAGSLARRLAEVPEAEREALVLGEVREHAAAILGHPSPDAIDPQENFKDLGFDSLGAVELRNRLSEATGVRLEATLVFDHPNCAAIAAYLLRQVESGSGAAVVVRAAAGVDEPVAIVGIGCRFPGGVASPHGLWDLVAGGGDGVVDFPTDRGWDLERLYDPDPDRVGKTYVREGGFLENVADFDSAFFGIGPKEALAMDPQQRLLLETSWEALEGAGISPGGLRGSSTGVFAGLMLTDYAAGGVALSGAGLEGYGAGLAGSVASGRIAYALGLEGPAMTIDTACSSSLVAMHLAAQALRSGECDLALAGGATVMSTSGFFTEFSRQRVLSPDGRAKSFAASADGTAWGEGCGIVALERLSDAKANGRRILAVLRGSATNQDGASNGLTAPNGPSQERVIRQALANAGLTPAQVDAVEAHGTGTVLGDPIEAQALLATYGQERENGPLALGSLKSNFGHTQAAAGVGGVIKMVMALQEETLPPTLHVDEPTPHVDWDSGEVELLTEPREWKRGARPRRAGISSFGISGTNAHLILEEPPEQPAPQGEEAEADRPSPIAWALSAKTPEALREYAGRLAAHVERAESDPLDVAHTLLASRASLPQRAVVVGESEQELLAGLDALATGKPAPGLAQAKVSHGKTAFLLSGQGAQRPGMGSGLYEAFPVYREAFDGVCAALEAELGKPVKEAVFAEAGTELSQSLSRTDLTQASLFALEVALYELLASFGARPDYLIGHSIGEIAAAHLAGVLSLEDAAKLVAARGALMAALPEGGAMASIRATEGEVEESLAAYEGRLCIAAVNAPASISVSGEEDALSQWEAEQEEAGRKVKRLDVSHAFHSHRMEPMLEEFEQLVSTLDLNAPAIPIVSNLSGEELTDEQATSAAYWAAHVRRPVRFAEGVARLRELGTTRLLELGPDAVLTAIAAECIEDDDGVTLAPALRREQPEPTCLGAALGALRASGGAVDLSSLCAGGSLVELPSYAFQRERYWLEVDLAQGDPAAFGQSATEHPLLGSAVALADGRTHVVTGRISQSDPAWIADHEVMGTVILPGTALVELALRTGREIGAERLEELVIEAPLPVPEGAVQVQVTATRREEDPQRFELAIHSRVATDANEETEWTRHASGVLGTQGRAPTFEAQHSWPPDGAETVDTSAFYDVASEFGVDLGPAFQGVEQVWRRGEEIFAEVSLAEDQRAEADRCTIHPALLDAATQAALIASDSADFEQGARLPFAWTGVDVDPDTAATRLRIRVRAEGKALSIEAADPAGVPVCSVEGLHARPLDAAALRASASAESLFELAWTPISLPASSTSSELDVLRAPAVRSDGAAAAHELAVWALERIQQSLAEARADRRIAFLTEGAVALSKDESPDPAAAAIWGLVRSAQSEHPGRFILVDSDGRGASSSALDAVLSLEGEPQIALREGNPLVPRLARVGEGTEAEGPSFDPAGTVLVTGGLSGLGSIVARHLARAHHVTSLVLASRRGPEAPGAAELLADLAELGCEARAVACDVGDRGQVEGLLREIAADPPLTGVVHCAGVLDDRPVEALDAESLDRVLAPKADGAWNLHELTRDMELDAFVLYSSIASTLGTPGQGNYAAANSFLDALAARRGAEGLPATSVAWGLWAEETEMTAGFSDDQRTRLARIGLTAMAPDQGLELLDRALRSGRPLSVAIPLEARGLRRLARAELLPPILSGLVQLPARRSRAVPGSLVRRLEAVPEGEREQVVLEVVREHVALTLGHDSPDAVDVDRTLLELGMDSLGAVELRNRLVAVSGVQVPPTAAFEHPTTAALAAYLGTLLAESGDDGAGAQANGASPAAGLTLRSLFVAANGDGRTLDAARLLIDASRLRPSFENAEELGAPPQQIPISTQGAGPLVLCLPSFLAGSGPHQFARLGQALGGRRKVTALTLPGHRRGESLPATWEAAIEVLAPTALEAAGGEPFVLLGYSSGGAVARALVERLEGEGEAPAGLAMIDSYLPDEEGLAELFGTTMGQLLAIDHDALAIDDDQLIAMGAYLRLIGEWEPVPIAAPGLMLRASGGLATMLPASAELPDWQQPQATVEVSGDHFSLIADNADATAEAIDAWLSESLEPQPAGTSG